MSQKAWTLCFCALFLSALAHAESSYDDLRSEIKNLRQDLSKRDEQASPIRQVDTLIDSRCGPNAVVTTRSGKLQIGGLLQVWFYHIQNDENGIVKPAPANAGVSETNELLDNDTFRIRRTELRFTLDINENITGY